MKVYEILNKRGGGENKKNRENGTSEQNPLIEFEEPTRTEI
jgi:hypothetical protein